MEFITIINILILIANVGVLGLGLKIYTELIKDRKIEARKIKDLIEFEMAEGGP
jgi:hypothetical protein